LWDLPSGREVAIVPLGPTFSALFSPSGDALVTAGVSGVRRWRMATDRHTNEWTIGPYTTLAQPELGHRPRACFSRDGNALAATTGGDKIALIHLDRSGEKRVFGPHPGVAFVALSPDGRWMATGTFRGAGGVEVWDVSSGKPAVSLLRESEMTRVAFSPDGRWLLTSTNREHQLWEVGTWRPGRRFERDNPGLFGPAAFSRDGRMLALASTRYTIQLIDLATHESLARLESPAPQHLSWLCFGPDGSQLAAASENHAVQLWDLPVIRRRLADMRLDWDLPPYPPAPPNAAAKLGAVKVVLDEDRP
jgi:eukaryotic-like serine/threonine-protein kinase